MLLLMCKGKAIHFVKTTWFYDSTQSVKKLNLQTSPKMLMTACIIPPPPTFILMFTYLERLSCLPQPIFLTDFLGIITRYKNIIHSTYILFANSRSSHTDT